MFRGKKSLIFTVQVFMFILLGSLAFSSLAEAQWAALPPYNVLWPLWSPALSPKNSVTGLPTPLVTSLSNKTVLPAQPAMVWDPVANPSGAPWLVYNVPVAFGGGLTYFQDIYGFNPWPPKYLVNATTGAAAPITLPVGYQILPNLTPPATTINTANLTYAYLYGLLPADYLTLLTAAQLWGIPAI
jgi:hypothetical protein